ncbi:MAG: hypothetical protein ACOCV4_04755 [Myxococcota bacterium]
MLRHRSHHAIASAEGGFESPTLTEWRGRPWATWSDPSGAYARPLEPGGAPAGERRSLGPPCRGGLAVAGTADALWAGCLRPGDGAQPGRAQLLRVDEASTAPVDLGPAGRDSRGLDVAVHGERASVVWHDGTPGAWTIRQATVDLRRGKVRTRPLSEGRAAETPTLLRHAGRIAVAWVESWLGDEGTPRGRVILQRGNRRPEPVAKVHWAHPLPSLAADGRGPVLAFRDARPGHARPGLYLQRLSTRLQPVGSPKRVGRADGPGRARPIPCRDGWTTVAPITWNRHRLVNLARVDAQFEPPEHEHRLYEWGTAFVQADALCRADGLLLLLAERGDSVRPAARLRAAHVAFE